MQNVTLNCKTLTDTQVILWGSTISLHAIVHIGGRIFGVVVISLSNYRGCSNLVKLLMACVNIVCDDCAASRDQQVPVIVLEEGNGPISAI